MNELNQRVAVVRAFVDEIKYLSAATDFVTTFTTQTNVKEEDASTTRRTVTPSATAVSAIFHSRNPMTIASLCLREVTLYSPLN